MLIKVFSSLLLATRLVQLAETRALPADLELCNGKACRTYGSDRSTLHIAPQTPSELSDIEVHDFHDGAVYQTREKRRLFAGKRGKPSTSPDVPNTSPGNGPSDSPSQDPATNPSAGLNPFRDDPDVPPTSQPNDPADNPAAGLDPFRDNPTTPPTPTPSTPADVPDATDKEPSSPTQSGSETSPDKPDPDDDDSLDATSTNEVPDLTEEDKKRLRDYGCDLKRTISDCSRLGPSGDGSANSGGSGDAVPGERTRRVPETRKGRPKDDQFQIYDYQDEVIRERGTGEVNEHLSLQDERTNNNDPDKPIRTDEIERNYEYTSQRPSNTDTGAEVVSTKQHPGFRDLLDRAQISFAPQGRKEGLASPDNNDAVTEWSWTDDNKVIFADWSFKDQDTTEMQAHWTELSMAVLKKGNVDLTKVEAIGRASIINDSTRKTVTSMFKHVGEKGDVLRLARTDDGVKGEAFDAFFRTSNGRSTLNLLAYYRNEWGNKKVKEIIVRRDKTKTRAKQKPDVLVVLE